MMLTRLIVRNFKRFDEVAIELGNPVIFIGPNNSGKTTALQALALWAVGLRRLLDNSSRRHLRETIRRRDLFSIPVPSAKLLWRDLHLQSSLRIERGFRIESVPIEIVVEGVDEHGLTWLCGLEFVCTNEESLTCKPIRLTPDPNGERMSIPAEAGQVRVAYLPPMSGLTTNETRLDIGAINVCIGEGRTAEVLRNLCYRVIEGEDGTKRWQELVAIFQAKFGVTPTNPVYIADRGELSMSFETREGTRLDLSSAGRGLQQTLLLLAHMYVNSNSVLLLDEPDAHLEILRQRQVYQVIRDVAYAQQSQIVAASHSEVIMNEAVGRDLVIAFVGRPHRIDDRGSQVLKALSEIGFEQYYQAEQTGWLLYLEGSTDLAILRSFAITLAHPVAPLLEMPFVHYVYNQPTKARNHFYGLREAKQDLAGIAIFDRLERGVTPTGALTEVMWRRRELENYLCQPEVLLAWAADAGAAGQGPLFAGHWRTIMQEEIDKLTAALQVARRPSPWSEDIKASDEFLDPLFANFYQRLGLPNLMRKTDYHVLAGFVPVEALDPEIGQVLDRIVETAQAARPAVA